ncbi:hypothetical protein [Delftia acidovorans]|uniref:Uncharacterized protein n=1 Tax=Delftia acidovorans TaxID=80866 RepID=A0AAJ2R965_DELAC|nr:hypothetical protein [Delftia acidovorans]MDX4957865.1 hypothetical protein [Delftia acidovorans]
MAKKKLPAPRLQLRWMLSAADPAHQWECHYELVMPLRGGDIRAERIGPRGGKLSALKELAIPMKPPTLRGGKSTPCTCPFKGTRFYDAPYRDGAHAQWDAAALGNLPLFVIAPDGMAFSHADDLKKQAAQHPTGHKES